MEPARIQQTGYALPLTEARTLAARLRCREKVLAYVTRRPDELLVFEHESKFVDAGVQVPAGGVEPGETPEAAARRETLEESGLSLSGPVHLASCHWRRGERSQVWHYYWLTAPPGTPDAWTHRVTDGERDKALLFHLRFAPLSRPELIQGYGYDAALPHLTRHLAALQGVPA
ncbi:NUDIX hydrolase [Deinococcus budaensis]|uniref:8-oxo-dGTP pyrophosphatase MutT (NUDIX family) n=1 Tax=Deinococcus budaensis TaxID=1665626 RepID=A0A7W8LQQ6_9DEIO|nr:NUDIX domain-containing protein [Deinococcus budaensis]MBB5234994.1 8-oxo-dGTP pyrophosphatase MutT (NUDIX family) [Deinococcus budaensis]